MTHPTPIKSDTVQEIAGEPFRFKVASRSTSQRWLVEIETYDGIGSCDCPGFRFYKQPKLEMGERDISLRCYHIERARDFLLDKLIAQINAEWRKQSA